MDFELCYKMGVAKMPHNMQLLQLEDALVLIHKGISCIFGLKEAVFASWLPFFIFLSFLLNGFFQNQGVVTYMSPVEAFATGIKIVDRQKVCLIA